MSEYFIGLGVFIYNFIKTLKEGEYFGELEILMRKPRLTTAVALTDVQLAYLTSSVYSSIYKERC